MTRAVCVAIAVAVVVSLLLPIAPLGGLAGASLGASFELSEDPVPLTAVEFPIPIDTSEVVPEYTLVSRALMLPGGSSDVVLDDLNDDGLTDLIVSVYESLVISVFYRQIDGTFLTYPSLNVTTAYSPMTVSTADVYGAGGHQLITLEKDESFSDARLAIYNMTGPGSFERWPDKTTYANAVSFVMGDFSADSYVDIAVVCSGTSPQTVPGRLKVFFGPDFATYNDINVGLGPSSLAAADVDDDSEDEIAVANYYSHDVMIFERPFNLGALPSMVISVIGFPTALACGNLDGDTFSDLAVITNDPNAVRFHFQSLGSLPVNEDYNVTLPFSAARAIAEDFSDDGRLDLVLLSQEKNVTCGLLQGSSVPIWSPDIEFVFPTSGMPRGVVVGDLDGQGSSDVAVASTNNGWAGSSIAIYPSRIQGYSNSNATSWLSSLGIASMLATGDVNGDDTEDLLVAYPGDNSLEIQFSFSGTLQTIPLDISPDEIIVSDFNQDNFSDILITSMSALGIRVLLGAAVFPGGAISLTAGGPCSDAMIGDFNDDSRTDIAIATEDGRIDIFFNDGSYDAFTAPYEFVPSGGAGIWSIASGDFNSDGLDDVAYTLPIRKIAILLQDPVVPFGPQSPTYTLSHSVGADFTKIWSGDLNGDSKTDISAMRPFDTSMYLFDQADFQTSPHSYGTLDFPEYPEFVSVLDATDDGPSDVLATFEDGDLLFLYRQESGTLPSMPSMVFVTGSSPQYACIGDGTRDHRGDLLVLDSGSNSVSVWQQNNFPPIAHSGGPYVSRQGDYLQFNGSSTTGTSEIPFMDYYWDFGDGNTTGGYVRDAMPQHRYLEVGNYSVTVDVRDPAGLSSSDSTYVIVLDSVPLVAFDWTPEAVGEGQVVAFEDRTTSYDPVATRSWYVNGLYAGGSAVIFAEFQNGTQNVQLEVVDSDGSTISVVHVISVGSSPPVLRIDAPTDGVEGTDIVFTVLVDEWHGGPVDPIDEYEWDFTYVTEDFNPDPYVPNSDVVSHVFSAAQFWQVYRVAVRVTDSDGVQNLTTFDVKVFDTGPSAAISLNTSTPREGIPFSFVSSVTSYDGIVNWTWELKHPDNSTERFYVDGRDMTDIGFDYLTDGAYSMTLTVRELDGNTSVSDIQFTVLEVPPFISASSRPPPNPPGYYVEFTPINFTVSVVSIDAIALYEWDFDAHGGEFIADYSSAQNRSAAFSYTEIGNYTAKARVTDVDGSSSVGVVYVEIRQKELTGRMWNEIQVIRGWYDTQNITYDARELASMFPDIVHVIWEFGDGVILSMDGPPVDTVTHFYAVGRDYAVNVTIVDDDGYSKLIAGWVFVTPPEIILVSPQSDSVVRSGTPIQFQIVPGSRPVNAVFYDINNKGYNLFAVQYLIDTTGWLDDTYDISIMAWDEGGNMAFLLHVKIIIDDIVPASYVSTDRPRVFGGDSFRIVVWANDRNVEEGGIVLNVKFPGDRTFLRYPVSEDELEPGRFYADFRAPETDGTISFFANVTDLAGNMDQSPVYVLEIKLHLISIAWPYLLTASIAAALGTMGYFLREEKIAVDETFVIYRDGRMISHSTRRLKPSMDDQILSSMFVAIQDFVKESFKDITSFTLRKLEFGDKTVLVEKSDHLYLAVVLHGPASRKVVVKMQLAVAEIEKEFGHVLAGWDGDLDSMRGVSEVANRMYSRAPLFPRRLRNN